jgi:hypothetical protein
MAGKRGRPTKAESLKKALSAAPRLDPWNGFTDAQVLRAVHDRFDVMNILGKGSLKGDVRSLMISGAPGISKTYTIEQLLAMKAEKNPNFRYKVVKGNISPVNLFMVLQDYMYQGNVVVLDDADGIFGDPDGVALLKAALDSTPERWISWFSETSAFKQDGEMVYAKEFLYNGSMIFITNTDFQAVVDEGKSKMAPHFEALLSRSMYLDLKVHDRRAISIWVEYLINSKNILKNHYGITKDQQKVAVKWLKDNRDSLRTLSIRDAMKIGQMMSADPKTWEKMATILLLKQEM